MIGRIFEKLAYRFFGCFYSKHQNALFNFVAKEVSKEFLHRELSDLGCGDGFNTLRLKGIFRPKKIIGYEYNNNLIEKARGRKLEVNKIDLNKEIPKGEMAVFNLSLHHIDDKRRALESAVGNFDFIVLLEPIQDWYHLLFDAGKPLKKQEWIDLFDSVLREYSIYRFKNFFLVFWKNQREKQRSGLCNFL